MRKEKRNMNKWNKDLKAGKAGEQKVANTLINRGWQLEDVSDNKAYQKKDIDFIIYKNEDDEHITIEVKSDTRIHSTGNFFIETIQNAEQNKVGWFYYCKADYLFYLDTVKQVIYSFKLEDLKEYIAYNTDLRQAALRDTYKTVYGILVNQYSFFFWLKEQNKFYQILEVE